MTPELEKRLNDLVAKTGLPAERLLEKALSDYDAGRMASLVWSQCPAVERVPGKVASASVKAMRTRLEQEFGSDFFLAWDLHGVRLSWTRIQAAGRKPADVRAFAARAMLEEGAAWLERTWTLDELELVARGGQAAAGWKQSWANSFDEERSADVALQHKPWKLIGGSTGTTHGSPYPYDRRVPLAFLGAKVKAQQRFDPASPTDALPTLLALLGLGAPADLDGRTLELD